MLQKDFLSLFKKFRLIVCLVVLAFLSASPPGHAQDAKKAVPYPECTPDMHPYVSTGQTQWLKPESFKGMRVAVAVFGNAQECRLLKWSSDACTVVVPDKQPDPNVPYIMVNDFLGKYDVKIHLLKDGVQFYPNVFYKDWTQTVADKTGKSKNKVTLGAMTCQVYADAAGIVPFVNIYNNPQKPKDAQQFRQYLSYAKDTTSYYGRTFLAENELDLEEITFRFGGGAHGTRQYLMEWDGVSEPNFYGRVVMKFYRETHLHNVRAHDPDTETSASHTRLVVNQPDPKVRDFTYKVANFFHEGMAMPILAQDVDPALMYFDGAYHHTSFENRRHTHTLQGGEMGCEAEHPGGYIGHYPFYLEDASGNVSPAYPAEHWYEGPKFNGINTTHNVPEKDALGDGKWDMSHKLVFRDPTQSGVTHQSPFASYVRFTPHRLEVHRGDHHHWLQVHGHNTAIDGVHTPVSGTVHVQAWDKASLGTLEHTISNQSHLQWEIVKGHQTARYDSPEMPVETEITDYATTLTLHQFGRGSQGVFFQGTVSRQYKLTSLEMLAPHFEIWAIPGKIDMDRDDIYAPKTYEDLDGTTRPMGRYWVLDADKGFAGGVNLTPYVSDWQIDALAPSNWHSLDSDQQQQWLQDNFCTQKFSNARQGIGGYFNIHLTPEQMAAEGLPTSKDYVLYVKNHYADPAVAPSFGAITPASIITTSMELPRIEAERTVTARYDLTGRPVGTDYRGLAIVRYSDGTSEKTHLR